MIDETVLKHLETLDAPGILRWVFSQGQSSVFTTSLGVEDQVILDLLASLETPGLRIATLDTGRLNPETYAVLEENRQRYPGKPIQVFFPQQSAVEEMVNQHGINLFYRSPEDRVRCCAVRKVEPLGRALAGAQIWITGLRQTQGVTRSNLKVAEWDPGRKKLKIAPLWNWTRDQVWAYLDAHSVPRNALHAQGYPSIGCAPCTRAVKPGEDERSGRWWWENPDKKECGLHQDLGASKVQFKKIGT